MLFRKLQKDTEFIKVYSILYTFLAMPFTFLYVCMCVCFECVCVSAPLACLVHTEAEEGTPSTELELMELWMVVLNHHVCAGN